jgi:cobalamin biosynthesis protein CobT
VGLYRCGSLTKTNAILKIFKLASHVDQSKFRGRSVAKLVAPYHRMLDSFEKEIIKAGRQDHEDKEEDSEDGKGSGSDQDSAVQSDNEDSKENSKPEDYESNSASEDDKPLLKKQQKFKLDLSNLSDLSVIRRSKKLPLSLRKTNSILANWAHDPKHVKQKWLESPSIPEFPESELYNIIQGRVVNFDIVFPGWYSDEPEHDHEEKLGKLKFKVRGESEPSKSVRSSQDWNVAYSLFAHAMRFAFPHRINELDDYGNYIHRKFAQNVTKYHSHIIAFDKTVRKRVSQRRDLQLTDFDLFSDLYEGHFSLSGRCTNEEGNSSGSKRRRGVDY